jgi:hypothetical protein
MHSGGLPGRLSCPGFLGARAAAEFSPQPDSQIPPADIMKPPHQEKPFGMRAMMAAVAIVIALSAIARGQQHAFVPRPTAPMPAALVP